MSTDEVSDKEGESIGDQAVLSQEGSQSQGEKQTRNRVKRLGILQLGWHAHEKNAPGRIQQLMITDDAIRIPSIIPLLEYASQRDQSVKMTYLCHPGVEYITKQKGEGSFCGYRNMQMMISYVVESDNPHAAAVNNEIPSISRLQDLIEDAWDQGINSDGRVETGGIRGTRKHVGTPEVQALFKGLGISCSVGRYVSSSSSSWSAKKLQGSKSNRNALDLLLDYVENYFKTRDNTSNKSNGASNVHVTRIPPIYLQRPHHSITIVGIEVGKDGKRNLLVFDPAVKPSEKDMAVAESLRKGVKATESIKIAAYRRGKWDLGLYKEFETLCLDISAG